ncbi:MAG TPA: 2TM domain-containing protein [Chloroflexia bacterium]|nr:2TM domain-containing protein [Chloroflexia bacterium]
MSNYYSEQARYAEAYRLAEQRVKARIGFYWHLASYVVVNGALFTIWLLTGLSSNSQFEYPWFLWPLCCWGIGLVLHFLGVFVISDTPENRQRLMQRELDRMGYTPMSGPIPPVPPVIPPSNNVSPRPEEEIRIR